MNKFYVLLMSMKDLLQAIAKQEKIADKLEVTPAQREDFLKKVRDFAHKFIDDLPEAQSFIDRKAVEDELKLEDAPKSLETLLEKIDRQVLETGLKAASGGHVGYIPGGGIYAAALGDFLAAVSNVYAGVEYASPGAVAIENEVIDWL